MSRITSLRYSTDENIQAIPKSLMAEAFRDTRRVNKLRCIYSIEKMNKGKRTSKVSLPNEMITILRTLQSK